MALQQVLESLNFTPQEKLTIQRKADEIARMVHLRFSSNAYVRQYKVAIPSVSLELAFRFIFYLFFLPFFLFCFFFFLSDV